MKYNNIEIVESKAFLAHLNGMTEAFWTDVNSIFQFGNTEFTSTEHEFTNRNVKAT